MWNIVVVYTDGAKGSFGAFADRNVATQVLALLAGKPTVLSAHLEEQRVVGL